MNALVIPQNILAELPATLAKASVTVVQEPLEETLANRGFVLFRCVSVHQDSTTLVRCSPEPKHGKIVTVEAPWQGLWKIRMASRLIRRITEVLIQAGARSIREAAHGA